MTNPFRHGMSLRNVRRQCLQDGWTVEDKIGTGEEVYRHPHYQRPITVNKRRHDAPRVLTRIAARIWDSANEMNIDRRQQS
jgi:hypothetical protein